MGTVVAPHHSRTFLVRLLQPTVKCHSNDLCDLCIFLNCSVVLLKSCDLAVVKGCGKAFLKVDSTQRCPKQSKD